MVWSIVGAAVTFVLRFVVAILLLTIFSPLFILASPLGTWALIILSLLLLGLLTGLGALIYLAARRPVLDGAAVTFWLGFVVVMFHLVIISPLAMWFFSSIISTSGRP